MTKTSEAAPRHEPPVLKQVPVDLPCLLHDQSDRLANYNIVSPQNVFRYKCRGQRHGYPVVYILAARERDAEGLYRSHYRLASNVSVTVTTLDD